MKRLGLALAGLALAGAVSTAHAQLTMQMSNGWTFSFAGNVNAFLTFERIDGDGTTVTPGGLVPTGVGGESATETRIRTGLLPAFAVFDAKGKEGNTDLSVHFGFAPQIQCASAVNDCFGAQIDMRQVYMTIGGSWGQILAGRELGLYGRQNILTDQTLFGVGGTGSGGPGTGGGTTLGRIGYGYIYPNFRAQFTYSTVAGRPAQFSIGLFEATAMFSDAGGTVDYFANQLPRVEAEFVYNKSGFMGWLGGLAQSVKNGYGTGTESAASFGGSGGIKYTASGFSITGSGYAGKGLGTTFFGNEGQCSAVATGCGTNGSDDLRKSYGYIGQLTYTPTGSKVTLAGSYGASVLTESTTESDDGIEFKTTNALVSAGIYYQATKSLKVVGEFNYAWTKGDQATAGEDNKSIAPAVGLMLFF